jgi:iron complex outermembrane receptor protein
VASGILTLALMWHSPGARAADAEQQTPGPAGEHPGGPEYEEHRRHRHEHEEHLEEVIVTAQKRSENLQEIPLAITALSGDDLQRSGIFDAQGLNDVTPALMVGDYGSTTVFTIRGVTTNTDPNFGDAPTAFHIDGIYQGRPAAASGLFYDIARVEVLNGPQGTLYGKNSTGGTINLITNKPSFGGADANFAWEFGDYYYTRGYAMLNAPVSDELALRLAAQSVKHTGYLKTGYDDADDVAGRIHVLLRPSESLSFLLTQDYFHQGGVGNGQIPIPQPGDYWESNPWSVGNDALSQQGNTVEGHSNNVSWQTSLTIDADLGMSHLTSISAYHHLHLDASAFLNGTPSRQQETDDEVAQELRLSSPDSSPTKWVAGLYFHRESQWNYLEFFNQAGPGVDSIQNYPTLVSPSYAAFGQITYPIRPNWRITAGIRATRDEKTIQGAVYQRDTSQTPPLITLQTTADSQLTYDKVTWRVGMDTNLTDKSLLFFNVSTGFKAGGVFAGLPPNTYLPESVLAYEIGSKNRFLNDRLQVNIDAFYYDYKDYQVDQLEYLRVPTGPPAFGDYITNAGRTTNKGAELAIDWLATPQDTVSLTVAYLDAVFQDFLYPQPPDFSAPPSTEYTYKDLSGYTVFLAPHWRSTLTYEHTWLLPHGAQMSFFAQGHAESEYWLTPDHKPDSLQKGFTRSQLALQFTSSGHRYQVQAYVRNVENSAVYNNYTFQGPPPAHNYATIGPPRTWGIALNAYF